MQVEFNLKSSWGDSLITLEEQIFILGLSVQGQTVSETYIKIHLVSVDFVSTVCWALLCVLEKEQWITESDIKKCKKYKEIPLFLRELAIYLKIHELLYLKNRKKIIAIKDIRNVTRRVAGTHRVQETEVQIQILITPLDPGQEVFY